MYYRSYHRAHSITEAINLFNKLDNSQYIAGGTDLMVDLRGYRKELHSLVDISEISELKTIKFEEKQIRIGAAVTHQQIIDSTVINRDFPLLAYASKQIGAAQIQHMGTIGGNIANASPAGDMLPPLYILDARLRLSGIEGVRDIPIKDFILGVRKTALQKGEMIKEVIVDHPGNNTASAFLKYGLRESQAVSVVSVAVILKIEDNKISSARIALGAVSPTVARAVETEQLLVGKLANSDTFELAGEKASKEAQPIDDIRGSAVYRRYLIQPLVKQCLETAMANLSAGEQPGV